MRRPPVGVAGLWHETNTYSAQATEIEAFELLVADAVFARHRGTRTVVAGMLATQGYEIVPDPPPTLARTQQRSPWGAALLPLYRLRRNA